MTLRVLRSCGILSLCATAAWPLSEYRLGGADGNPWQASLSVQDAGQYVVLGVDGQVVNREPVAVAPGDVATDTLLDFSGAAIRPRFIDPGVNMALLDTAGSSMSLPYTGGEIHSTIRCIDLSPDLIAIRGMFDGDPRTAMFRGFTQDPSLPPGYGAGWGSLTRPEAVVVDLGAAVPVNRIRFYPRLSREQDRLLVEELRDPRPPLEAFGEDSFRDNYLAWYQLRSGDDSAVFRKSNCDIQPLPWVTSLDPQLSVLKDTRENLDVVVDLRFRPQSIRWLTLRPFPVREWEVAEFEVYGEGFVNQTGLTTQILDFGRPINWGKVRWSGEQPEGTRVQIHTRMGSTPDPNLYFAETENRGVRRVTRDEYYAINITERLPISYDADSWSYWSPPYDFEAGLRDPLTAAESWQDGTPMVSPGPSRYIQIAIRLFATFADAPRLDQLTLQLAEIPSAQQILGEVWPIEVESFAPTSFTYVVRPAFQAGDAGFDRLEIHTATRARTVRSLLIDGEPVDLDRFPVEVQDDHIVLSFPELAGLQDNLKQLEASFDVSVLRFGTEFRGWVYDSKDPLAIKQRVQPGNATYRFSGNVLAVKTPLGGDLLLDVEAAPRSLTPNGDGINETVTISYKLRELTSPQDVSLRIHSLAGAVVRHLPPLAGVSGEFHQQWDGRDDGGRLVPPGIYAYELSLHAQEGLTRVGLMTVVY